MTSQVPEVDLSKCPGCGGEADNGHDRCDPPNVYYCTKCSVTPEATEIEEVVEMFYLNFTDAERPELDTPSWNDIGITPHLVEQWLRTTLLSQQQKHREESFEAMESGYKLAVKHLKEAYSHNGATTVPEAIEWLEDNAKYI